MRWISSGATAIVVAPDEGRVSDLISVLVEEQPALTETFRPVSRETGSENTRPGFCEGSNSGRNGRFP
ncbi:hypothetical protein EHYA_00818 [Embleya hyalina]|uniref:Uncharacterized protein n=1 Tax=Embleya hyalina TaxID=516124 RepID=A0A401YF01_9ACTN|nr:hypothetical protein EHYA_00818 [Embleya hyalina]